MIRLAQLMLLASAAAVWTASRLRWVSVRTFDGLGLPKITEIAGATWSTALLPLAVLLAAAALAGLAARGWLLRLVALLVGLAALAMGYLGVSLITMADVGPRGAALAGVPVMHLIGSQRHLAGAWLTLAAALCAVVAAALLMRAASAARITKYVRSGTAQQHANATPPERVSERVMWDALDAGHDPTDSEGR